MNTIRILSFAGACMTFFYLVYLHTVGGTYLGRRIWLTVAALFYLVPLENLKRPYIKGLHELGGDKYMQGMYYSDLSDFVEIHMDEFVYKNETLRLDTIFYAVWMTGAAGILLFNLVRYFVKRYRMASQYKPAGAKELETLERLRSSMKIRRKVRLVFWGSTSPTSTGFFRPVVILPEKMRDNLPEAILKHELTHIKNCDMPVMVILNMINIIHWLNPFAYILTWEYKKVFELMCDEKALDGCSKEVRDDYVDRLLEESKSDSVKKSTWFHHLSKESKFVKERINNIMYKKRNGKIRTCVGSIALVAALFVSSLTAFAYEDVHGRETQNSVLSTQWIDKDSNEMINDVETWFYVDIQKDSLIIIAENAPVLYDEQFVDADGNVYEVHSDASPYYKCDHSFKDGVFVQHTTYKDGSCTMEYYEGQMCTMCSYTIVGDFISSHTYAKCPH